ncbi:MAG: transporter [bacterium]
MRSCARIRPGIFATSLLLTIAFAQTGFPAPITFSTALPVADGQGIFRIQSKLIRSTQDPGTQDREVTVRALPLVAAYGATRRLAIFGIVPILNKKLQINATGVTRDTSGLGDITLLARYTAWKKDGPGRTTRLAPFIGIEAPTGKDNEKDYLGTLPQTLQPGSGSWDYTAGAVLTSQTFNRQIDVSVSHRINTEANDFEFGDETRLDLSWQKRVGPKTLGSGVPAFIYAVFESNLIYKQKNRTGGAEDRNSGGTAWFFAPGIQRVTKKTVMEAAVQVPVVQNLNGNSLENDFTAILSFRVNL